MKSKSQYCCQSCGFVSTKWLGRCPGCGNWNSLVEELAGGGMIDRPQEGSLAAVREEFRGLRGEGLEPDAPKWVLLDSKTDGDTPARESKRLSTGMGELDRVLGGGLVADSFTLLGGDPGIGKSTLLLQMAKGVIERHPSLKVLYVSGEESIDQIRGRAKRLNVIGGDRVYLAAETELEQAFATIKEIRPDVVIMDSLQTFSSAHLQSAPGSVGQVREIASRLMMLAKTAGISVWLVGHVTKEGNIAGPKTVEHMVDTVLYFEGDGNLSYRLLRTVKNRFGSTRELGVFEMDGEGLREVSNPSSLFLSEREKAVSGTAVAVSLEGSRPILVELQALVVPSGLAVPRRTAVGFDSARVALLAAILDRHMNLSLSGRDLFFNVAGGLRLSEPACDLGAAAAIWSSAAEEAFPADWTFIGELGLTGDVRRVSQIDVRLLEAKKLGFNTVVMPESAMKPAFSKMGLKLKTVTNVGEIAKLISGSNRS